MVFLLAPDHKRFFAPAVVCLGLCALVAWACAQFYLPGKGFTYLIEFGELQHERFLPALKAVHPYEVKDKMGYDAQYYAQMAMEPNLGSPDLRRAVDSLPYRARRILLSWIAYALGGGDPVRALNIFAFENIFSWFALAALFCRWAPPWKWTGLARWVGLLLGFGLCCSLRGALVDGPSLLMIAGAVALAEEEWWWSAAVVLGLAGLMRETNLLAVVILIPKGQWKRRPAALGTEEKRRDAASTFGQIAMAVAPLIIWLLVLRHWLGSAEDLGARNFAAPTAGYFGKWSEIIGHLRTHRFDYVGRGNLLMLVGLTAQMLGILYAPNEHPQWRSVGAVFAGLGLCLGPAVWEGYPGAAARVLLPMTAAFFVLVPLERRRALPWLLYALGAMSVVVAPEILSPPGRESVEVRGPRELRIMDRTGQIVDAVFGPEWYDPEKSWLEYWRWCKSSGTVTFVNPHPFPVKADISFGLRASDARTVAVRAVDRTWWFGRLTPSSMRDVKLTDVTLPPGDTTWKFESLEPPLRANAPDARDSTFSLRDLRIDLHGTP